MSRSLKFIWDVKEPNVTGESATSILRRQPYFTRVDFSARQGEVTCLLGAMASVRPRC